MSVHLFFKRGNNAGIAKALSKSRSETYKRNQL